MSVGTNIVKPKSGFDLDMLGGQESMDKIGLNPTIFKEGSGLTGLDRTGQFEFNNTEKNENI